MADETGWCGVGWGLPPSYPGSRLSLVLWRPPFCPSSLLQVVNVTGNQDICYYNFLCAHPLGNLR